MPPRASLGAGNCLCAGRIDWERLARSMDGPCAAHATDETSVVPVSAAILAARLGGTPRPTFPAAWKAAFPVNAPRGLGPHWRRGARLLGVGVRGS